MKISSCKNGEGIVNLKIYTDFTKLIDLENLKNFIDFLDMVFDRLSEDGIFLDFNDIKPIDGIINYEGNIDVGKEYVDDWINYLNREF